MVGRRKDIWGRRRKQERERERVGGRREGGIEHAEDFLLVLSMLYVSLSVYAENHYYCYPLLPSYVAKASLLNIFPCTLQGAFFAWKATAMGKNYINGKTFLEKR